jgi:hypothetical protein
MLSEDPHRSLLSRNRTYISDKYWSSKEPLWDSSMGSECLRSVFLLHSSTILVLDYSSLKLHTIFQHISISRHLHSSSLANTLHDCAMVHIFRACVSFLYHLLAESEIIQVLLVDVVNESRPETLKDFCHDPHTFIIFLVQNQTRERGPWTFSPRPVSLERSNIERVP